MVNLKVTALTVLLLGFYVLAKGNVCVKRFVKGKWRSFGDCGENRGISEGVASEIRERARKENGIAQESPGPGWQKSGNRFFKCFNDDRKTYQDAKDNCTSYRGRLAAEVLRDPVAARYIITHCLEYAGTLHSIKTPWIGFDDIAVEGEWIWSDGGAINNDTTKWDHGQPSKLGGDGSTIEDCANILRNSSNTMMLNDDGCGFPRSYVCEV